MCIYAEACFKHITMKFLSFVTLKWYSHLFAFLNVFLKYLRATWWAFSFSFRGTLWILQVLEFKIKLLLSCSRNVVSWKSGISLRKHFDIYVFMVRVETASAVLRWGAFGSYVSLPFPFFFFFLNTNIGLFPLLVGCIWTGVQPQLLLWTARRQVLLLRFTKHCGVASAAGRWDLWEMGSWHTLIRAGSSSLTHRGN